MPSACVDVSVRHVRPSGYGRGRSGYGSANVYADGYGDGCAWTGRASVCGYVCGDARVSPS